MAMQLLERHGVVTREAVLAEGVVGGYAGVYGVLKVLEERGQARRGWFVAGLGAAQFAVAGAVDRLRSMRDRVDREVRPADVPAPVVGWEYEGTPGTALPAHIHGRASVWNGDYVEFEYVDPAGPPTAFPGGFYGERFFFQSFDAPLDLSQYRDEYRDGLQRIIDAKIAGEDVVAPEAEAAPKVVNLMEALRKSLDRVSAEKKKAARAVPARAAAKRKRA